MFVVSYRLYLDKDADVEENGDSDTYECILIKVDTLFERDDVDLEKLKRKIIDEIGILLDIDEKYFHFEITMIAKI
jgi:hypothetical protein